MRCFMAVIRWLRRCTKLLKFSTAIMAARRPRSTSSRKSFPNSHKINTLRLTITTSSTRLRAVRKRPHHRPSSAWPRIVLPFRTVYGRKRSVRSRTLWPSSCRTASSRHFQRSNEPQYWRKKSALSELTTIKCSRWSKSTQVCWSVRKLQAQRQTTQQTANNSSSNSSSSNESNSPSSN